MDSDLRSDDSLMEAAQKGDLDVMGTLFRRHYGRVFGFLRSMAKNEHAAEDLAQDVFMRAVKYRASYQPGSQFTAWLFRIARNVYYDWAKLRSKRNEVSDANPNIKESDRDADAVVTDFGLGNDLDLLRLALNNLPEEKREIIVMSRFQGMSCADMAEALGCKIGTVKARVFRALKALKIEFDKLEKGEAR